MLQASLRRNGPRSGLLRATSKFRLLGGSILGKNLDHNGDGEGVGLLLLLFFRSFCFVLFLLRV